MKHLKYILSFFMLLLAVQGRAQQPTEGSSVYRLADFYDFTGGLNVSKAAHLIADNETPYSINTVLYDNHVLTKRPGYEYLNDTPISGNNPVWGIYRFYKRDGTKKTLAACNGNMWVYNTSTGGFDSLGSGLTTAADNQWRFVTYQDRVFCCNGTDSVYIYEYNTDKSPVNLWYTAGLAAPDSVCTGAEVTTQAGSILAGDYLYRTTFYDSTSGTESNGSSSSATVTVEVATGPSDILVESIPTPVAATNTARGVTQYRKIYRTEDAGGTYYLVGTLEDSTTTSFTDTTADADLPATSIPTTNGIPPEFSDICVFKGQLIGIGDSDNPDRVNFSSLLGTEGPEAWNPLAYVTIDSGTGGTLQRVIPMGDELIVFGDTLMYRLVGGAWTATKLPTVRFIRSSHGTVAPWSVVNCNGVLIYWTRIGETLAVYLFDGNLLHRLSEKIEPDFDNAVAAKVQYATAAYTDGKYRLAYCDTREGTTTNNRVIEYDVPTDSWWPLNNLFVNCWSFWDGAGDTGELCFGSARGGYVCDYGNVAQDPDAVDVYMKYRSKNYDINMPQVHKRFRLIYLDLAKGPKNELGMKFVLDYGKELINQVVDISSFIGAEWAEYDPNTKWPDDKEGTIVGDGFYWAQSGDLQHKIIGLPKRAVSRYFAIQWENPS